MVWPLHAATDKHTNIRDVLSLFFREDIIAWSARRSGRHASAGAGLKPAHLKQLVQLNVEKTFERLKEVGGRTTRPFVRVGVKALRHVNGW